MGAGVRMPGHHVLALGVHEVLAVELVLAGGGVAGEGHARAAVEPMFPKTIICTLTAVPSSPRGCR